MPAPTANRFLSQNLLFRISFFGVLAIFLQTVTYGFIYDDFALITLNPWLQSWHGLGQMFTHSNLAFLSNDLVLPSRHYRPLYFVWLFLIRHIAGPQPGWFHLAGILLHLLVTYLAFVFARKCLRDTLTAATCAVFFALHPSRAEAVSWISAHTEVLLAAFVFGALISYARLRERRSYALLPAFGVFLCTLAGLLTKESAAVIPVLIVLYEWLERSRDNQPLSWPRALLRLTPSLAAIAAFAAMRSLAIHGLGSDDVPTSLRATILTTPLALCAFLRHSVWPVHLSEFYPALMVDHFSVRWVGLPLLALSLIAGAYAFWARRSRVLVFAAAWFLVTLAPILFGFSWIQLHDRHLYLPLFGFCLMLAVAVQQIAARMHDSAPQRQVAITTLLAVISIAVTAIEVRPWRSELALFSRAVEVAPNNSEAVELLAQAQEDNGNFEQAMQTRLSALQRLPNSCRLLFETGSAYSKKRLYDQAQSYLQRVAYSACSADRRSSALAQLGSIAFSRNEIPQATTYYEAAVAAAPNVPGFRATLARLRSLSPPAAGHDRH